MVRSIIITGKDLVEQSAPYNDTYNYSFPTGMVRFADCEIAVASVALWYSWYNITVAKGNNTYSYVWNAAVPETVQVTIPDGWYSMADLNKFIQYEFIKNGHYLINQNGCFIYYAEIIWNPNSFRMQINCYPLPTSLPSGWTNPGTWSFAISGSETPQLIIPANLSVLLGFLPATYPPVPQATNYSVVAPYADKFFPVSSTIIGCSLLQNTLAIPATTLFTMPIENHYYGEIYSQVGQFAFVPMVDGQYSNFSIQFFDQDGNRMILNDTDVTVSLVIRKKGSELSSATAK